MFTFTFSSTNSFSRDSTLRPCSRVEHLSVVRRGGGEQVSGLSAIHWCLVNTTMKRNAADLSLEPGPISPRANPHNNTIRPSLNKSFWFKIIYSFYSLLKLDFLETKFIFIENEDLFIRVYHRILQFTFKLKSLI